MDLFFYIFIPLFVAIDPIGLILIFTSLTKNFNSKNKITIINHSVISSFIVAMIFLFTGRFILLSLGVSVYDMQVAGGIILFLLASKDLMGEPSNITNPKEIGIAPLGCPLIVGPTVITSLLFLSEKFGILLTLSSLCVNLLLLYILLRSSNLIIRFLGENILKITSTIIAMLLVTLGVGMVIEALKNLF